MNTNRGWIRLLAIAAVTLVALAATDAIAQQKQKVTLGVSAADSSYTQRQVIDVGDEPGHQIVLFEIHRKFTGEAPVVNGLKLKESFTRGYADYMSANGLSHNYGVVVAENGDKFYTYASTLGQADASGKRSTVTVGQIRGGTGKFAGIKGTTRGTGISDGKAGRNEGQTELEYWFDK